MNAVDLITKILGVFAALLGTAGYVLVLGAAILWLRLRQVDLPPEVPVSLASREELIATGAQAVAVWAILVTALGGLAAWVVTGDPERRRFGYTEAGLALTVTAATLLALGGEESWMIALPAIAALVAGLGALFLWPSLDAVTAVLLPIGVGSGLAVSLSFLSKGSGVAAAAGAACIFGVLVLFTPVLQNWRARLEKTDNALVQIGAKSEPEESEGSSEEAEGGDKESEDGPEGDGIEVDPLLTAALERAAGRDRSPVVVWVGRVAIASLALVALGVVAVASQVDSDDDFHKALVSLTNGDCLEGTYIARGADQIMIAQPVLAEGDKRSRISAIPIKEVLEVQVFNKSFAGKLDRDETCSGHKNTVLVHPGKDEKGQASPES